MLVFDVLGINSSSNEQNETLDVIVEKIHRGYVSRCLEFTGAPFGEAFEEDRVTDRRESSRRTASIPFYLSPLSENGEHDPSVQVLGLTRDLSPRGIGIQTDQLLAKGLYLVEFDCIRSEVVQLLIEVVWVQKKSRHCFYSGARILSSV